MATARSSSQPAALLSVLEWLPSVPVEESAWAVASYLDEAAAVSVARALRDASPTLQIARVEGSTAPDDPEWHQLVFVIDRPGKPGSARWRLALEAAGEVLRRAAETCPDAASSIATQFTFDL